MADWVARTADLITKQIYHHAHIVEPVQDESLTAVLRGKCEDIGRMPRARDQILRPRELDGLLS